MVEAGPVAAGLGWHAGDRVCATSHCGCGYCRMCLTGRYNLCLNYGNEAVGHRQYGHYTAGGYAEYVAASVKSVYRIPDQLSLADAAVIDPLSIALYTVKRTRLEPGADIVILGTGPQGLMAILCAAALGAGRIIAAGSGERLARARELGAIGIDYRSADVVDGSAPPDRRVGRAARGGVRRHHDGVPAGLRAGRQGRLHLGDRPAGGGRHGAGAPAGTRRG